MAINMKSFLKTTAVILLVLCFSFAVGCKDKDYVADYSNNDMPTLPSKTESGKEQIGEDNVVNIDDLLNPDKDKDQSSKNQGGSSAKPSTGSSSSSGSSSTASIKPSSSSSKASSSSSSKVSSSSKPASSQSTTSVKNEMATGTDANAGKYDTPDNTWFQ